MKHIAPRTRAVQKKMSVHITGPQMEPITEGARGMAEFWKSVFRDVPSRIRLSPLTSQTEPSNGLMERVDVGVQSSQFSAISIATVDQVASACSVTKGDVLFGLFYLLLCRYTGDDGLAVGVVHRGNIFPVVCSVAPDMSFRELVIRCQTLLATSMSREPADLRQVAQSLGVKISSAHQPLVQVTFMIVEEGDVISNFAGAGVPVPVPSDQPPFDMQVILQVPSRDSSTPISMQIFHRLDVIPVVKAKRMASQFGTLTKSVIELVLSSEAKAENSSILALPMLSEDEVTAILTTPNTTGSVFENWDESIVQSFYRQCQSRPDAAAVEFEGRVLSYLQLARLVSHYYSLLEKAVGASVVSQRPQPRVMICASRSTELLAALLAVIQLGAVYIPADSSTPQDRCASIMQDCAATIVLADKNTWQNKFAKWCASSTWIEIGGAVADGTLFTLQQVTAASESLRKNGRASCNPSRLHNVIYTSGSTGKPKGVAVYECSITNVLRDWSARSRLTANDVVLAQTSISFDPHSAQYFAPLMAGACILIPPDEAVRDGVALASLLDRCSVGDSTPSGWQLIISSGWKGNRKLKAITGGEALRPELAEKLVPLVESLQNAWGPTEATIESASLQRLTGGATNSIGRPLANQRIYIVNSAMQVQPIGVIGEVCVAGAGVAECYINQPDLTARKFLPDPFAHHFEPKLLMESAGDSHLLRHLYGDGRMYMTGDLACWREDFSIQYIGRADTQVKIRGYRVELSEIEQSILSLPAAHHVGVSAAVVTATKSSAVEEQVVTLIAYVVLPHEQMRKIREGGLTPRSPRNRRTISIGTEMEALSSPMREAHLVKSLREGLMTKLPLYMLPDHFVFLESLPLTRAGKLDVAALPKPDPSKRFTQLQQLTPSGPVEEQIAAIIGEVLGLEATMVPANAHLFQEMGITSLTALKLVESLNAGFDGAGLTVAMLFKLPTIPLLANFMQQHGIIEVPAGETTQQTRSEITATLEASEPVRASVLWDFLWAFFCLIGASVMLSLVVFPSWPALKLLLWLQRHHGVLYALLATPFTYMGYGFVLCFEMWLSKWVLIGRYRPATIPSRSFHFYRWWFVDRFFDFATPFFASNFLGTPLWNLWLWSLGTKVDMYSHIGTLEIREFDLITIGARSTINQNAVLRPMRFTSDSVSLRPRLELFRIELDARSWIGQRAVVPSAASLPEGNVSCLPPLSNQPTQSLPSYLNKILNLEEGVPFSFGVIDVGLWMISGLLGIVMMAVLFVAAYYPVFRFSRWLISQLGTSFISSNPDVWLVIGAYAYLQPYFIAPFLPVLAQQSASISQFGTAVVSSLSVLIFLPVTFLLLVFLSLVICIVAKWVLLGRTQPGRCSRRSFTFFRHWFWRLLLTNFSRFFVLFADSWVLFAFWKAIGARVHWDSWINGFNLELPDLVQLGTGRTGVGSLGSVHAETVIGDTVIRGPVKVSNGSMIGIHGIAVHDSHLPDGCTVGVLTALLPDRVIEEYSTLLLGEVVFDPRSAEMKDSSDWWRVPYSAWRNVRYALLQLVWIIVAPVISVLVRAIAVTPIGWGMLQAQKQWGNLITLALIPPGLIAFLFLGVGLVVLLKWLLYWRLRPGVVADPDSTLFNYQRALIRSLGDTVIFRATGGRVLIGSPLWNWVCNGLGASISGSALILTSDIWDFDLIQVDDGAVVEQGALLIPHMLEHDSYTFDRLRIERGVAIRTHSVCMHGVRIEENVELLPLSLTIPGQVLKANRVYSGVPCISKRIKLGKRPLSRSGSGARLVPQLVIN